MFLDVEVYPNIPRNWSKAVPKGNGPVPQQEEFGPDQPTLADVYRLFEESFDRQLKIMKSRFDQQEKKLNEFMEEIRTTEQRSASLEQGARQPRLAMGADVTAHRKTRGCTEGAAAAVQAKHEDSCSAKRVQAGPTSLTSSGMKAEPPALPRSDDVLVDKGATTPKPCLPPTEMRTLTTAGGLFPSGKASTTVRTIFPRPFFSWSLVGETKKQTCRISIQYASYYSSFWKLKVLETK